MYRHITAIIAGTLLSRILGLVRDMLMAQLFGNTALADALSVALRLPHILRRLLSEGGLSITLTSLYLQHASQGPAVLKRIAKRLALGMGCIVAFGWIFAPFLMHLLAPGAKDVQQAALPLFTITLPYLVLAVFSAKGMALCHSNNHFTRPSLSPALYNLVVLGVTFMGILFNLAPQNLALCFAAGTLAAGGAQVWLNNSFSAKHCVHTSQALPQTTDDQGPKVVKSLPVVTDALAGMLGAATPQLAFFIAAILASFLPQGHMASLFYAERLLEFPLGLMAAALSMGFAPFFTRLAMHKSGHRGGQSKGGEKACGGANTDEKVKGTESTKACAASEPALCGKNAGENTKVCRAKMHATGGENAGASEKHGDLFSHNLATLLYFSVSVHLAAALGLVAIATPLVTLVFGHGNFDDNAVTMTALALCAYAPMLPAYAAAKILLTACHALALHRTPFWAMLVGLLTTAVCGTLGLLASHVFGTMGPPLGASVGVCAFAVCLYLALVRRGIVLPLQGLVPQLLAVAPVYFCAKWTLDYTATLHAVFALGLAVLSGVTVYGAIMYVSGEYGRLRRFFRAGD